MASDHIRASDHDRDAVVATLRDAFGEGRLTLDEFQERTTAAYAGRTWGDLRELTTDLPLQPSLGADLPPGAHPEANAAPQVPDAQPVSGPRPVAGPQPANGLPPHPSQPITGHVPPPPPVRPHLRLGPVLPVVSMWILFALATRSVEGAVVFLVAVVTVVTLASIARRRS
jgi:hypothetical protein